MPPVPPVVDTLIVHQYDPAFPVAGGIDTVIRGLCAYVPDDLTLAVVGVNVSPKTSDRVGHWERWESLSGQPYWFLPVIDLDVSTQQRRVPHALRIAGALARYRRAIPRASMVQAHRMDLALVAPRLVGSALAYFVHTQESGKVGAVADSFWRHFGPAHRILEHHVARGASYIVVFNEQHSRSLKEVNPRTRFMPTWYDPRLLAPEPSSRDPFTVVWVGRLEVLKDPLLAVRSFASLAGRDSRWRLEMVGVGTQLREVERAVRALPESVASRVLLRGRITPDEVYRTYARAGVFLMTTHPGYEGYPMVIVEAMASGVPVVVTRGADPGGLVHDGRTGYQTSRDPEEIAARIQDAVALDRQEVRRAVESHSAPALVRRAFEGNPRGRLASL